MKIFKKFTSEAGKIISKGGIGVIPTDTIYGIVCSAMSKKAVERVYRLRKRNSKKPGIVLIGSLRDLKKFGIKPNAISHKLLASFWPGPVSVILPIANSKKPLNYARDKQIAKFKYLHRGKKAIAFRLPANAALRRFLRKTGSLIAPSANFEGEKPATSIKEAQKYFGDKMNFYIDGGILKSKPSTLISIKNGKVFVIRKGTGIKLITDN